MKALFLDVDGVLNTYNSKSLFGLSEGLVKNLRDVVNATGCEIVLSSTWRQMDDAETKLRKTLQYKGMRIASKTPVLWQVRENDPELIERIIAEFGVDQMESKPTRGMEIHLWLMNHSVDKYAIVDDNTDFLPYQMPFFVKTEMASGLTDEKASELIRILK